VPSAGDLVVVHGKTMTIASRILILLLLTPALVWAQEETLTRKQTEELVEELAGRMRLDFDMSQTYANAGNEIAVTVSVLRLLRTSDARDDENVQKAMNTLEVKLDGYLVTFITYSDAKKSKTFDTSLITFLNRAREYRTDFPRDCPSDTIASAVGRVFAYAQAVAKKERAQHALGRTKR